jgi:hypothetical protein
MKIKFTIPVEVEMEVNQDGISDLDKEVARKLDATEIADQMSNDVAFILGMDEEFFQEQVEGIFACNVEFFKMEVL